MSNYPKALIGNQPLDLNQKLLWSVADVCAATSLCRKTVDDLIRAGKLPATRVGRRILLDPAAVKAALLNLR